MTYIEIINKYKSKFTEMLSGDYAFVGDLKRVYYEMCDELINYDLNSGIHLCNCLPELHAFTEIREFIYSICGYKRVYKKHYLVDKLNNLIPLHLRDYVKDTYWEDRVGNVDNPFYINLVVDRCEE